MMDDPVGFISLTENYAMEALAASSAFQTLTGAANATEAKGSIYLTSLPDPADGIKYTLTELQDYYAFGVVSMPGEDGFHGVITSKSDGSDHKFSVSTVVWIVREVPSEIAGDHNQVERTFKNIVGQIVGEMSAVFGTAGYPDPYSIVGSRGPDRVPPQERRHVGDAQEFVLLLEN